MSNSAEPPLPDDWAIERAIQAIDAATSVDEVKRNRAHWPEVVGVARYFETKEKCDG